MRAMILAAGLGKRMRPLTEHVPKPLLQVEGKYLIEHHLQRLADAGIQDVVINTHWLAQQIPAALGNGEKWGLRIHYSHEHDLLETAGGIVQALPILCADDDSFLLINGDIYSDFDLSDWLASAPSLSEAKAAYLALVDNPEHNPTGDFYLSDEGLLSLTGEPESCKTYAGIALFHKGFFSGLELGPSLLGPQLKAAIGENKVIGSVLSDFWLDVGTPERLAELRTHLSA